MPRLRGKELTTLYPTPKTYVQLKQEREARHEIRRPKFVAEKLSIWIALVFATVIFVYGRVVSLVGNNLSSAGMVLFGVAMAMLFIMAGLGVLFYLYLQITGMVNRVFTNQVPVYFTAGCMITVSGALLALKVPALFVIVADFVLLYGAIKYVMKRQKIT